MNGIEIGVRVQNIGTVMLRYGVVVMLLMIGASKWTPTEAEAIRPRVSNSPFLSEAAERVSIDATDRLRG